MGTKILIAITSANNLELTKKCVGSIDRSKYDIVIVDDASTELVEEYCNFNHIPFLGNTRPCGVTSLWNKASLFFKGGGWDKLIISNNDVIYSKLAIDNLSNCMDVNNLLISAPLTNKPGSSHVQNINRYLTNVEFDSDQLDIIQSIESKLIETDSNIMHVNRINGFCFMINRETLRYANTVDGLFPPHFINTGNEDWLCDEISRNEPNKIAICFKSYVFHYKAKTTKWCKDGNREALWRESTNEKDIRYDKWKTTIHSRTTKYVKPNVLCTANSAMGLGDGVMLISTIIDLSKTYNVSIICSEQSFNIAKLLHNGVDINVYNMDKQGHFYNNDYYRSYNITYWDRWNSLRQFPHNAVNMIREYADLPPYQKKDKKELYPIPIDYKINEKVSRFIKSLKKPIIVTQPFMSYWNKMIDSSKYHRIINELVKLGTVIQIGGNVPPEMISKKCINLIGNTSLEQSCAIIKHADLLVSGDSFIQHAAATLKTPAVVMFCGTSPEEFGYPFNSNIFHPEIAFCQTKCGRPTRWLYDYNYQDKNVWNSRSESGWICPSKLCERTITVDEVIEAAKRELSIGKDRDWSFYDYVHG